MKVEHVFAQVRAPKNGDQGVTVEGCFTDDGNRVTMTDREGKPIVDNEGCAGRGRYWRIAQRGKLRRRGQRNCVSNSAAVNTLLVLECLFATNH